jgi:hypothetical protein
MKTEQNIFWSFGLDASTERLMLTELHHVDRLPLTVNGQRCSHPV